MKTNISAISPMSNGKWTASEKEESVWLEPGHHPQGSLETAFLDVVLCCPWMASSLALRTDYSFLKKKKRRWKLNPFRSLMRKQNLLLLQGVWQQRDDFHIRWEMSPMSRWDPRWKTQISAAWASRKNCSWRPSGDRVLISWLTPLIEARPGKRCVCMLYHAQPFTTPWAAAYQVPLPMEFSRQEYWNGLPFPPTGDLLDPGFEPVSPALAGRFFTTVPYGKPERDVS